MRPSVFKLTFYAILAVCFWGTSNLHAQITYNTTKYCPGDPPTNFTVSEQTTAYNLATSSATTLGACGVNWNMFDQNHYAALDPGGWQNGAPCGACAVLSYNSHSTTVMIVDECGTCGSGTNHLDLSKTAYEELLAAPGCANYTCGTAGCVNTGGCPTAPGAGQVTWHFIQCPLSGSANISYNNGSGNITYEFKDGSSTNSNFWPIVFWDTLFPIQSVQVSINSGASWTNVPRSTSAQNFWGGNTSGEPNSPLGNTIEYAIKDDRGNSVTIGPIGLSPIMAANNASFTAYGTTSVQFPACVIGPTSTFTHTPTIGSPTATFTLTRTPTPTITPTPLAGCPNVNYNGEGAPTNLATGNSWAAPAGTISETAAAAHSGSNGMQWNMSWPAAAGYWEMGWNWDGSFLPNGRAINLANYSGFSFWIKATAGSYSPLVLYLADTNNLKSTPLTLSASYLPSGITTAWQQVTVPIAAFSFPGPFVQTSVWEIDLEIFPGPSAGSGTMYFDDFALIGPCPTNTPTHTNTASFTSTPTVTKTPTPTYSLTPTNTSTVTNTFTSTPVPPTNTFTPTQTNTSTKTNSPTNTSTSTATNTSTNTSTFTATSSPTNTLPNTSTFTATSTPTITSTFTPTFTSTKTNSPTNTSTATYTNTATNTSTPTLTFTFTATRTNTFTFTSTSTPTITGTPTNTNTGTQSPSATPTNTGTSTNTPTRTNTPTYTSTSSFTSTSTNTSTSTPTFTSTRTTTATPSVTATPTITNTGTLPATNTFTNTPTLTNTFSSTATYSATPSPTPTNPSAATSTATPVTVPVAVGPASPTGSTQLPGNANVPVLQFQLSNPGGSAVTLTSLTLNANGSGNSQTGIISVNLYLDANANGIVDSGDTLLGTAAYSAANGTAVITLSTSAILPTGPGTVTFLVVNNFSASASGNFVTSISNPPALTGLNATGAVLFGGALPLTSAQVAVSTATSTPTITPTREVISSPYPNPSIGGPINVDILSTGNAKVKFGVFTAAFRKIFDKGPRDITGNTTLTWDLKDNTGSQVASGLYYLRIELDETSGSRVKIKKVLIIK